MKFRNRENWRPSLMREILTHLQNFLTSIGRQLNPVRRSYKNRFESVSDRKDVIDAFIKETASPKKLYRLAKYVDPFYIDDDQRLAIVRKLGRSRYGSKVRELFWSRRKLRYPIHAMFEEWDDYYREIENSSFDPAHEVGAIGPGKDWRDGFHFSSCEETVDLICTLTPPKTHPRLQQVAMKHRSLAFRDAILKKLDQCPFCAKPFEQRYESHIYSFGYPTDSDFRGSAKDEFEIRKRYFFCRACDKNLSE